MANNFSQAERMEKCAAPESQLEAADAVQRRLPPIDMESDGTKPDCRKEPQPGLTIDLLRGACFKNARDKVALRFGHVRLVVDSGSADKAVRASANF